MLYVITESGTFLQRRKPGQIREVLINILSVWTRRGLKIWVKAVKDLPFVIYYYYVPDECRCGFIKVGLVLAFYQLVHVRARADTVRPERHTRDKGFCLGIAELVVLPLGEQIEVVLNAERGYQQESQDQQQSPSKCLEKVHGDQKLNTCLIIPCHEVS